MIIVDDMIDTAGTLCTAANEMKRSGALRVFAFATHGLFNGPAAKRIEASHIDEVIVSNTVPLRRDITDVTHKIRQISVGKLLEGAEAAFVQQPPAIYYGGGGGSPHSKRGLDAHQDFGSCTLNYQVQVTGSKRWFFHSPLASDNDKPARFVDVHPGDVFVFPPQMWHEVHSLPPQRRPGPGAMALKMHLIAALLSFVRPKCWVRLMPLRLHFTETSNGSGATTQSRVGPSTRHSGTMRAVRKARHCSRIFTATRAGSARRR